MGQRAIFAVSIPSVTEDISAQSIHEAPSNVLVDYMWIVNTAASTHDCFAVLLLELCDHVDVRSDSAFKMTSIVFSFLSVDHLIFISESLEFYYFFVVL